jgi:parallel beta-helix repeat protein
LDSCQYITITSCSVNHNSLNGILLIDSSYIKIIDNRDTINFNEFYGIQLIRSHHNNITNNIINENDLIGIYLDNSDFNFIDWNTLLGYEEPILDEGQNNDIGNNNITSLGGYEFPFEILLLVLIITIAILGSIVAIIIVKKRRSISGKVEKEISEKKKEKIKIKLEEKLRSVDHLIEGNQIKLAYKNLGKVKDTADRYEFFAIFNQADKKLEICKAIEAGIYTEVKSEELFMPVATEKRKEFKIFLSYSTIDSDRFQIKKIVKHLEKFTEIQKVYYYTKDSGQNIVEYMEKTLSVCNIFVLFCTKTSKDSKAVKGEWQSAYQLVKRDIMKIIPIYEDEDDIPLLLIPMLNIRYDEVNFKEFINKLYLEILR